MAPETGQGGSRTAASERASYSTTTGLHWVGVETQISISASGGVGPLPGSWSGPTTFDATAVGDTRLGAQPEATQQKDSRVLVPTGRAWFRFTDSSPSLSQDGGVARLKPAGADAPKTYRRSVKRKHCEHCGARRIACSTAQKAVSLRQVQVPRNRLAPSRSVQYTRREQVPKSCGYMDKTQHLRRHFLRATGCFKNTPLSVYTAPAWLRKCSD